MRIASPFSASFSLFLAVFAAAGCGGAQTVGTLANDSAFREPTSIPPTPTGRLPNDVTPLDYAIELTIDPHQERYHGNVKIHVRLNEPRSSIFLHAADMELGAASVDYDRHRARVRATDQAGVVRLDIEDGPILAGEAIIQIAFTAPFRDGGDSIFKTTENGEPYVFTQFEPISARRAFPCFDEPGWKMPIELTLIVQEGDVAVANTRVSSEEALPTTHQRRVSFAPTEALPIYLLAFGVGKLDVVEAAPIAPNAVRATPLPFRGIAMHGRGGDLAYSMERIPALVAELERYTGIAYPFDKLDVLAIRDFPGAMENAGAITFDESLLLIDPRSMSVTQQRQNMNVMAHELAHQWFGNLVTMAWWDDLWLNESFATWMASRVVLALHPDLHAEDDRFEEFSDAIQADSRVSARRIRQPIESSHDIINAFDAITYSKGGAVLAMLETWLGADVFQRGIHEYLTAHARGNATVDDLESALSQASGRDVRPVLRSLVDQAGAPFVEATLTCDASSARLTLHQSRYTLIGDTQSNTLWQLPVCARYGDASTSHRACTVLTEADGTLELEGATGCPTFLTANADGTGYYQSVVNMGTRANDLTKLQARERAMHASSLVAAMRGAHDGRPLLPAADALRELWPLIGDSSRIVSEMAMQTVRRLLRTGELENVRDLIAARARTSAAPILARIGWTPPTGQREDGDVSLMRADVVGFLAFVARDPSVRAEAVRRAKAFIGMETDHLLHYDAVSSDLYDLVLTVAVQDLGAPFFDALVTLFGTTNDALVQEAIVGAFGAALDPTLAERARRMAIESLGTNGVQPILYGQLSDPRTRAAAFEWLSTHFDDARTHMPSFTVSYLPRFTSMFCGANDAARIETLFAPRIAEIEGGPPQLQLTLEDVRGCHAFMTAQGESVRSYFATPPAASAGSRTRPNR